MRWRRLRGGGDRSAPSRSVAATPPASCRSRRSCTGARRRSGRCWPRSRGRAAAAAGLLLIAGYSGIGKSALVNEIHKQVVTSGAFVAGKFDQLNRSVPFAARGRPPVAA